MRLQEAQQGESVQTPSIEDTTLTLAQAEEIIGKLSNPNKMPWYAWSISAYECKTGSKLRQVKGSVCEVCYATKGRYRFGQVQRAHERRKQCLRDPRFVPAFVRALNLKHRNTRQTRTLGDGSVIKENRFRWHDAGDLLDLEHFVKIVLIAQNTPQIEHYLPTKEPRIVGQLDSETPGNLHIKISHPMVKQAFPKGKTPMGLSFTTVGVERDDLYQCPAKTKQGNKCLDCDACWRPGNVNYPLH